MEKAISKIEALENALIEGSMTYEEVADIIYSTSAKPWQTTEWKEKRKALLKDSCEQCNSTKKPFVLQHVWHPKPYKDYVRDVFTRYHEREKEPFYEKGISDKKVEKYIQKNSLQREACPKCFSVNFRTRKSLEPIHLCNRCKKGFTEPVIANFFEDWKSTATFEEVKRKLLQKILNEYVWETFSEDIRKEAILLSLKGHKRYISLVDTKTFCKRCAFLWDMQWKKVCDVCKENIIPIHMHACLECQKKGHPAVNKE